MSTARANICERLGATRRAVTDFNLRDLPLTPTNASHNTSVRIIRNGLAVQCFNILEDFAKARIAETLVEISASSVQFRHLPEGLQRATIIDAIKAIEFRVRRLDKGERIPYAQQYSARIASTAAAPMQLADIAFFHTSSNISKDQFRDALVAFAIDNPWVQISGLCSRLGLSGLPAERVFESLAGRRHSAAHDASASVSESDLLQSLTDAIGLAIGFDVLLSRAARQLVTLRATPLSTFRSIGSHTMIPLRFIKSTGRGFSEVKEGRTRSIRTNISAAALTGAATARARKENGALVIYDTAGLVVEWLL